MSEKLAQFRATHDNPNGSDDTFIPDREGTHIVDTVFKVIKGLAIDRTLDALTAKEVNPRSPETQRRVDLAHGTNVWLEEFRTPDSQPCADKVPNRKKKRRR